MDKFIAMAFMLLISVALLGCLDNGTPTETPSPTLSATATMMAETPTPTPFPTGTPVPQTPTPSLVPTPADNSTPIPTANATASPTATITPTAGAAVQVAIRGFAYSPNPLNVPVGTTVNWTNYDIAPHTVTMDSGAGPNSQTLKTGDSYSYTFTASGTYAYHCTVHPMMKATVVVG